MKACRRSLHQSLDLESGLMMAQVTSAALVAELRVLASPASTGSIPTSGNQEDFVSMGMTSALKLEQAVALARMVIAIELARGYSRPGSPRGHEHGHYLKRSRARFRSSGIPHGEKIAFFLSRWRQRRVFWQRALWETIGIASELEEVLR